MGQLRIALGHGTIFEDSPLGLDKWLTAVWLVVNCKNGISSYEMARDLGITQKSAWHRNQRIRLAMQEGWFELLGGEVVDETFIGGKARNMHIAQRKRRITRTGGKDKVAVLGMLELGGKVRSDGRREPQEADATVRGSRARRGRLGSLLRRTAVVPRPRRNVGASGDRPCRAVRRWQGQSNGMENYGALLKRGINETYISVEPFHLFRLPWHLTAT